MIRRLGTRRGVAMILALTILAVLVGMAAYFSANIGMELRSANGFLSGVKARGLAEAGLAEAVARIRNDVRTVRMFDPDFADPGNFPDLVHRRYSTRALPGEGVWGDAEDTDGDGETETDEDEIVTVDDKGTAADYTDDDGYYVIVRDTNALVDINALQYGGHLAQFPGIRATSLQPDDVLSPGSVADRMVSGRAALPGGAYTSVAQLRSVVGASEYDNIESEITPWITTESSDVIVSGGLVARYYGLLGGASPTIDYDDPKGIVIEHGSDGPFVYTENVFSFNNADQFAFVEDAANNGTGTVLPTFDATQPFAVVWTGFIFIPNETEIFFLIDYNGGLRMRIADQVLANTSSHWNSGNSGEIEISTSLPAGWQPVTMEYYSTGSPSINIHWSGGYHYIDPATGTQDASPDVDLRTINTRMPMNSFGFKAGGRYLIQSTGLVRDTDGNLLAEHTVRAAVRIWDYVHESTAEDFSRPGAAASHATFDDGVPIHPIGDSKLNWTYEFDPATRFRNYDTTHNAIKLGYWETFDDHDFVTSSDPAELAVYPFQDTYSLKSAWETRDGAAAAFTDIDGDGDRELVLTDAADPASGNPRFYVDLVGDGHTKDDPLPGYAFTNMWFRFDEDDSRGPLSRENYEGQSGAPATDFDGTRHNASGDPPHTLPDPPDPEDQNANYIDDGPREWWVGWGYVRFNGDDHHFGMKQEGFGPDDDPFHTRYPAHTGPEFETQVNGDTLAEHAGYTVEKTYAAAFHEDGFFYYRRTPAHAPADGFPYLDERGGDGSAKSVGFNSWGNETTFPRHIDNVRIIPISPSVGAFTSGTILADRVESWGVAAFTGYHKTGSSVTVTAGPDGNATQLAVSDGGPVSALGSTPAVQYRVELSMDFKNAGGNVELNYDQPVFADITMTYLTEPERIYYRSK